MHSVATMVVGDGRYDSTRAPYTYTYQYTVPIYAPTFAYVPLPVGQVRAAPPNIHTSPLHTHLYTVSNTHISIYAPHLGMHLPPRGSDPRLPGACEEGLGRMEGEKATAPLAVLIRRGLDQFDAFKCNNVPAGT